MPFDIWGRAALDYVNEGLAADIITFSSLDEQDVIPVAHLFRSFEEMPFLEQKALKLCRGRVLDVGCGTGSHSLWLQKNGFDVTALDTSKGAIQVCRQRGIKNALHSNILDFSGEKFDTLLFLMNGIGITGKLSMLEPFLNHLKKLLTKDGQILMDSSDIIYMFEEDEDGGRWVPGNIDYYGEVSFQMEYNEKKGPVFDWLYIDYQTLTHYAKKSGYTPELLVEGNHYDYLAKLSLINTI